MAPKVNRNSPGGGKTRATSNGSVADVPTSPHTSSSRAGQKRPAASGLGPPPLPHASKRRRQPASGDDDSEAIDLTTGSTEHLTTTDALLATQQEAAIKAQQPTETAPTKIGARTCIICMDSFTNASVTACGHIYCHECLTQALIASEKASERGQGNCPVCRKPIDRKKTNKIIPLSFMTKEEFLRQGQAS